MTSSPPYVLTLRENQSIDLTPTQVDINFLYLLSLIGTSSTLPSGLDYQSLILDGSGNPSFSSILYDTTGTPSVDFFVRLLKDVNGLESLDWGAKHLEKQGVTTLDWANRQTFDQFSVESIDWENRTLKFKPGLGTQVSLDWANQQLFDQAPGGELSIDWDSRFLYNLLGLPIVSWEGMGNVFQILTNTVSVGALQYTFPVIQGPTGSVLTELDGTGTLTWSSVSNLLTGTANEIPYFDSNGNLTSDSNFFRDQSLTTGPVTGITEGGFDDLGSEYVTSLYVNGTVSNADGALIGFGSALDAFSTGTGQVAAVGARIDPTSGSASAVMFLGGGPTAYGVLVDENGVHLGPAPAGSPYFLFPGVDGNPGDVIFTDGTGILGFTASGGGGNLPAGIAWNTLIADGSGNPTWSVVLYDLSGVESVWFDSRILTTSGQVALNWDQRELNDTSGLMALSWLFRRTYDVGGLESMDWNTRQLVDASGAESIDWAGRYTFDASGLTSSKFGVRTLVDENNIGSLDWSSSNRSLVDTNANTSLDWDRKQLIKGGTIVGDWDNQILYYPTGVTSVSWGGGALFDSGGTPSVVWNGFRWLLRSDDTLSVDWEISELTDGGVGSINWANRILQETGGHVCLRWNSILQVEIGDVTAVQNNTVFTVSDGRKGYNYSNLQDLANNAAALGAGLVVGDLYYTNVAGDGVVKVVI